LSQRGEDRSKLTPHFQWCRTGTRGKKKKDGEKRTYVGRYLRKEISTADGGHKKKRKSQ